MPRYVIVPESEVAPDVVKMAREAVRRAAVDLDLGTIPEIRWFADSRELLHRRVAAAREVYVPGDGVPKAGNVPPFVRYSTAEGWAPEPPVILLNRSACTPDTPLHELRHLWQIKAGRYRADEDSTTELEDDADAWAAGALARLEVSATSCASFAAVSPAAAATATTRSTSRRAEPRRTARGAPD